MNGAVSYILSKIYTDNSLKGISGTLAGKNCTISKTEEVEGGTNVTFTWTADDGTKKNTSIFVKNGEKGKDGVDGKDGKDGKDGIDGIDGEKGDRGDKGIGIESITKKSSAGLVDTYQIVFTDGTESSFDVVNGANITKTSQLENDSNFITNVVNNLLNYYTKDEVYTKANIDELLRNVGAGLSVKIVAVLPTEEISGTTIYLIKTSGNNYNQYMWIDNAWANLGSTTVDLSNYYTKDKVDEILLGYVTKDVLASTLIDYVKKSELAKVATSNDYNDLDNLPQIPDVSGIKPYTNVLQDSDVTAPTSKALYDAVQTVNAKLNGKVGKTDIATIIDNTVTDEQIASARAVLRSKSATRMDESVNPENYEVGAWFAEGHDSILLSTSDGHPCSEWHIGYVVTGYKASDSNGYKIILAIAMSGNCYIKVQQWDKWTDWKELATMDKVDRYSNSEIPIGTWVDGKTIYRKVIINTENITGTTPVWGGLQSTVAGLNINKCVASYAILEDGGLRYLQFLPSSGFISYYSGVPNGSMVVMEYTKTTDA